MFEQDYIMRLIHEVIRMVLKLLFHIDTESEMEQMIKEIKTEESLDDLMKEIDRGNINEAENKLYKMVDEKKTKDNLLLGLGFYAYLNEKDEDCPETTPERAVKFRRVNPPRKHNNSQLA